MLIRSFSESDWSSIWSIMCEVIQDGDTFLFEPDMTEQQGYEIWIQKAPSRTVVAVEEGQILGTAIMGPNRPGPGQHISTASFIVARNAQGRGAGSALCRNALEWARQSGYAGMQFNAVVESNRIAVEMYQRLGFCIIGTVPEAFDHPQLGRIGLHIMYCSFDA